MYKEENIEVAFDVSETLYGEFKETCKQNHDIPAKKIKKMMQRYVVSTLIESKGGENMKDYDDIYAAEDHELTLAECFDILEDMTCNMDEDERNEWLESLEY